MGLFFYINSVALIEDLPLEEEYHTLDEFYTAANRAYNQVCRFSYLMVFSFVFDLWRFGFLFLIFIPLQWVL